MINHTIDTLISLEQQYFFLLIKLDFIIANMCRLSCINRIYFDIHLFSFISKTISIILITSLKNNVQLFTSNLRREKYEKKTKYCIRIQFSREKKMKQILVICVLAAALPSVGTSILFLCLFVFFFSKNIPFYWFLVHKWISYQR